MRIFLYTRRKEKEREHQQRIAEEKAKFEKKNKALCNAVLRQVSSSAQWINMSWKQRRNFQMNNIDLDALSMLFGIEGCPMASLRHHLLLGQKIFGEDDRYLQAALQQLDETGRVSFIPYQAPESCTSQSFILIDDSDDTVR